MSWKYPLDEPNARCPICRQPVWFFRNERGGCAYFDAVGKPWPLHPCMEKERTAEDAGAMRDAISAHERRGQRVESAASRAGVVAPDKTGEDEPLDWWTVATGLVALLLSFPLTSWVRGRFDEIPPLLSLWAFSLPTFLIAIAIGWFLIRVPVPKIDVGGLLNAIAGGPILLLIGVLGNVLTCGLGVPAVGIWVILEANAARMRDVMMRPGP